MSSVSRMLAHPFLQQLGQEAAPQLRNRDLAARNLASFGGPGDAARLGSNNARSRLTRVPAANSTQHAIALCSDAMNEGLNLQGASAVVMEPDGWTPHPDEVRETVDDQLRDRLNAEASSCRIT